MSSFDSEDSARTQLQNNGAQSLGDLFVAYRERLRRAVILRIDPQVQGRIDPSDVIQETFIDAEKRLDEYLHNPEVAPYVWIRFLTLQRLAILQRFHLQAKQRDARREKSLNQQGAPCTSSVNLAACILDSALTPGEVVQRAELHTKLEQALEQMDVTDREVLVLRHFEQMSNQETAQALELTPGAASKRYYNALEKLQELLANLLGDLSGPLS